MILTCPSCSASYNVPDQAIGAQGRDVRCKKCLHMWYFKPEGVAEAMVDSAVAVEKVKSSEKPKVSLDELINQIQADDSHDDDISFADAMASLKDSTKKEKKKKSNWTMPKFIKAKQLAGAMVGIAVFMVCLFTLVHFRAGVVNIIPATENVYAQLGFKLKPYIYASPEESFVIEQFGLMTKNDTTNLRARFINLTSDNVYIPPVKVTFADVDGNVVFEGEYKLPVTSIAKEATYDWVYPVAPRLAEQTRKVKIAFSTE